jgi:hypothetical protein
MNVFNRILSVLFLTSTGIAGVVSLISPSFALGSMQRTADFGRILFGDMGDGVRFLVRVALAVLFGLVMLFLLWLELRRPNAKSVEVQRTQGGKIRLTTGDIQASISDSVDAIAGVMSSKSKINARNKSVAAVIEATLAPLYDPIQKGEEIAESARAVIEDQLGLKMYAKPHVTVKVAKSRSAKILSSLGRSRKPDAVLPPENGVPALPGRRETHDISPVIDMPGR